MTRDSEQHTAASRADEGSNLRKRTPRRRLVVSDIHGEGHRLERVLEAARYSPADDLLVLIGDYVDYGTNSAATVELVRALVRQGAVALRGNHDHVMLDAHSDPKEMEVWLGIGGQTTLRDYDGKVPADVLDWVANLPLYYEDEDYIYVHAGLRPGIALEEQRLQDLLGIREEFYESYRGKTVVFGHTGVKTFHDSLTPWYGECKIGIDTEAVTGGFLTLLDLDTGETWTA